MSAFFNDNQSSPSESCCTAKSNGMAANIRCGFVLAFATEIIPTVPNTALAPKLAVAEKHIFLRLGFEDRLFNQQAYQFTKPVRKRGTIIFAGNNLPQQK
jgi:hypothetical protein